MKKILYVLNSLAGGASKGIYEMIGSWHHEEYEAYAIAPPGNPQEIQRIGRLFKDIYIMPLIWWNINPELDIGRKAAQKIGQWRHGMWMNREVEQVGRMIRKWQIDIVHSGTSLTLSGALAAKKAGIPHIWHIKESIGEKGRIKFGCSDAELISYMDSLSAAIIAMSDFVAKPFYEQGSSKIHLIPDGVDLKPYSIKTERKLRQHLSLTEKQTLVGMVASFVSNWKQHDSFIQMASQILPNCSSCFFMIVGQKPSPHIRWPYDTSKIYYRKLLEQANPLFETGRFVFLDHYPDPPDLMQSLDILVHPCEQEPFGRIAIEAMAAGTPVVGPNRGGIAETVIHNETGILVEAVNTKAMGNAVMQIVEDPNLQAYFSNNGKKLAFERFSINEISAKMMLLYEAILK